MTQARTKKKAGKIESDVHEKKRVIGVVFVFYIAFPTTTPPSPLSPF